jgi:hypothetical protein
VTRTVHKPVLVTKKPTVGQHNRNKVKAIDGIGPGK